MNESATRAEHIDPALKAAGWGVGCGAAQAQLRAKTAQQLAAQAGPPHLREYLASRHIVLYAHSGVEVLLLALIHQHQLT